MQIKIHSYLFMIIVGGECLRLCAMCMHNCARCVFYNCIHKVKIDVCAMQFHRMKTANEKKKSMQIMNAESEKKNTLGPHSSLTWQFMHMQSNGLWLQEIH